MIVGSFAYYKARNALIDRTFEQLISVRIEKKNRVEDFLKTTANLLIKLSEHQNTKFVCAQLQTVDTNQWNSFSQLAEVYLHQTKQYQSIVLFSQHKVAKSISLSDSNPCTDAPNQYISPTLVDSIFGQLEHNQLVFIDNFQVPEQKKACFLMATKVETSQTEGVLILFIPIESINNIMSEHHEDINGLGKTGEVYLVGQDRLMRSGSRFQDNAILSTIVKSQGVDQALKGTKSTQIFKDYRNIEVLSSFSPIDWPFAKWVILAEIDVDEAMVPIKQIRNSILFLMVILGLLTLGAVAFIAASIASPIKILKNATEAISHGDYGHEIIPTSNDELGDLTVAFNTMTQTLQQQSVSLEEERKLRLTSLIDGQELERQRLSRELHDSLGQQILAIKMGLENALDATPEQSKRIVNEAINHFSTTTQEIRSISNNLMPSVLSEFGLERAIINLKRDFEKSSNRILDFEMDIQHLQLSKKLETYIFRICQEALNNTLKYAQASKVTIQLLTMNQMLRLEIRDNGNGFKMNESERIKGNGLVNMKERAHLLNGTFSIHSTLGQGTTIQIVIPLVKNKMLYD